MKVALVHDYLTQRGGAERVVLSMLKAFPAAPLHTSLYDPGGTFPEFVGEEIRTFGIDRSSLLRKHHRLALPLLARSFGRTHVEGDVVVCSSSGWAHGVRVRGRKIVYCYTPAHWLYDGRKYLGRRSGVHSTFLAGIRPPLVTWDKRAASTADRYITLSTAVRDKIRAVYGIDAEVVHPPPILHPDGPWVPVEGIEPGFFLCVSRLLPYKNVDAIVTAFSQLRDERLVVVGFGPVRRRLETMSGPNVSFLGTVSDAQLRWLYSRSQAVVAASYEDYGLTPLEGATFGKPAVVLRMGGFLDTVVDEGTGIFFDTPDPDRIAQAIRRASGQTWDADYFRTHTEQFSEERFIRRLRTIVREEAAHESGTSSPSGGTAGREDTGDS